MADLPAPDPSMLQLTVDGQQVEVIDNGGTLLAALRGQLGVRAPKGGCNPQGQCGCCTVLVDGAPRVACVTPARRVAGRVITTIDGLTEAERERWAEAFLATGASQCGFCTPGIICRLEGLRSKGTAADDHDAVHRALAAHLCRCTGWQTIDEAWSVAVSGAAEVEVALHGSRDLEAASLRATIEGRSPQRVSAEVVLGRAGFAEDTAPLDALVAVPDGAGDWVVAATLPMARELAAKIQGRHGTVEAMPPVDLPEGDWALALRTSWVEPAYLETDSSWCLPGGEPASPLANGGAFGGKVTTEVMAAARRLADLHGRAVRCVFTREDVVRLGPKRPPMAIGVRADGTGIARVARTAGIADALHSALPGLVVEELDIAGPPTSVDLRGAGWAEAAVLRAVLDARAGAVGASAADDGVHGGEHGGGHEGARGEVHGGVHRVTVVAPNGSAASAAFGSDGVMRVSVRCGRVLDAVVLRSYVIGAAHMAMGWVASEGLAVGEDGIIGDLTIRSFGVLRASETPPVEVELHDEPSEPVNGSDAAFAAVAAALGAAQGCPVDWPTRRSPTATSAVQP